MLGCTDALKAFLYALVAFILSLSFLKHPIRGIPCPSQRCLDVFAALWAQDVITLSQEATTHQGHRALLTVEAVIVPLALLKGNVLAPPKA